MKAVAVKGFTLVEMLVGVAIFGMLLALAAPNFAEWMQNSRIRTATESIQNGLQLARTEAVRRNTAVSFYLTSSVDATCVLSTTDTNWVVTLGGDNPTGNCGKAPINDALGPTAPVNVAPRVIQRRSAADGSNNVVASSTVSVVSFNGLGRGTAAVIGVNPASGNCRSMPGGSGARCLAVTVTTGGEIRFCDPAFDPAGTDPQRC